MSAALELDALDVAYAVRGRDQQVLTAVSLAIPAGGAYGLVGESGSGKSTLALAALGLLPKHGRITHGSALVGGEDVAALAPAGLRRLRARSVSMVFQDPGKALNPTLRIGRQLGEAYEVLGVRGAAAREQALAMLAGVQIASPERVLASYPHQLSGGMQQRVLIALALAKHPALLVLDEPTTGLDATVEAEVLDLIAALRRTFATAILLISHNLGIVGRICERVGVLYAGHLVEEGPVNRLLAAPRHPYTFGLLSALPRGEKAQGPLVTIAGFPPAPGEETPACVFAPRCPLVQPVCLTVPPPRRDFGDRYSVCHFAERVPALGHRRIEHVEASPPAPEASALGTPILEAQALSKTYDTRGGAVHALAQVSLHLARGETLGVVGESGCGKTTLARLLVGLVARDEGVLHLDGASLSPDARGRSRAERRALQIIFQNPDAALNRALSVKRLIGRVLRLRGLKGAQRERRMRDLLAAVRLEPRYLTARPPQLSGGLKQRVAIARAFANAPRIVLCDEVTSALDVSVQAAILNLLVELQRDHGTSYLFISHDLAVVRYLADRIAVLYLGHLIEVGPAEAVLNPPYHPYTEALLSSVPGASHHRIHLHGAVPSPAKPPSGCVFHTRCPRKIGVICETVEPPPRTIGRHSIRCHIPLAELKRLQSAAAPTVPPLDPPLSETAR